VYRAPDLKAVRAERSARHDRRRALFKQGISLSEREPVPRRIGTTEANSIKRPLYAKARSFRLSPKKILSFAIRYRRTSKAMPHGLASTSARPMAYHILFCESRSPSGRGSLRLQLGISNIVALIGKEVNGTLVSIEKLHSR
jgi:hypothetical protein